ncbi:hypothetical protein N7488_000024 [Penicillium malachiteum]|nr:hypothetical protein N7488_000024 [Penicillium malachiteum]
MRFFTILFATALGAAVQVAAAPFPFDDVDGECWDPIFCTYSDECCAGSECKAVGDAKMILSIPSTFGLELTARSLALKGLNATEDASIATLLREAGCIVIGKSNLSQGQVNPHTKTPARSSSGSAVATAARFAPLIIETEADGSLVQPAIRAAAYGLKGTVGDVIMKGAQSGDAAVNSAGPVAKSVEDYANIMDLL